MCLFLAIFFRPIYNLYVELFYKKICMIVFFLDMSGNNNSNEEDNSGDDLDFYDFLEIISDKADLITNQSIG